MFIKTILVFYLIPVLKTKFTNTMIASVVKDVEHGEYSSFLVGGVKTLTATMEINILLSQKTGN